jgi:hypothetical protein
MGLLAASAASAYTFHSPEGGFIIEFPTIPVLTKVERQTAKGTPYDLYQWSVSDKDGHWAVAMSVYGKPRKEDYEGIIGATVAAARGRLASQKTVKQNGAEGREILIEAPKSAIRERLFWIGGRLYFVSFSSAKPDAATAPEVDEFLDSFDASK